METFKIKVNPTQSKIVQEELFSRGFTWYGGCKTVKTADRPFLFINNDDRDITFTGDSKYFAEHDYPELTFREFGTKYITKKIMKEFKIEVPEGYEFDTTNSLILFKEIKKELPQSWKELGMVEGYYITTISVVKKSEHEGNSILDYFRNSYPTKELAEASLALTQLLQLRDRWNDGWIADYTDDKIKWAIICDKLHLRIVPTYSVSCPMVFKSEELVNKFLAAPKIRELLEIAKPLL